MQTNLITRDSKGKIRIISISLIEQKDGSYNIERKSGLLEGKMIAQPTLSITKGKVKRTVKEQALLEYNSLIKKQLDKGYKDCSSFNITNITIAEVDKILPKNKTDQKGTLKPMLCKLLDKNDSKQINKEYFGSFKLDGVRALLYWKNGKVYTSSRGGQDYNIPAKYIREDPYINKIFTENPTIILDGEIYRHGWTLNTISGLCRKEVLEEAHKELKFYCYDIVDENKEFKTRLLKLEELKKNCPDTSKLVIIPHTKVKGLSEIMEEHNKAVAAGYEGLVIRDPNMPYKCGARDFRMMKIKEFSDAEFLITGLSEGLREEDMCFTLLTNDGNAFKAKPMGTREDKQWYREHIEELIGKYAVVKYFGFTNTDAPVPNLPVLKSIRLNKDM